MFHSPWMLDSHRKRDCLHSDAGHPLFAFSSLLAFQSLKRHDPFKWLFTCIRRKAKALLNELLSTIQLEWPSLQHYFPHYTMLSTALLQHGQKREAQKAAAVTPGPTKVTCLWDIISKLFLLLIASGLIRGNMLHAVKRKNSMKIKFEETNS